MNDQQKPSAFYRQALIIWGCFMMAMVVYLAVGFYLVRYSEPPVRDRLPLEALQYAIVGASAILFALALFLRARRSTSGSPAASSSSAVRKPGRNGAGGIGQPLAGLILALGLAEAIGILGLVLVILGGSLQVFCLLLAASVVAMILHRPRRRDFLAPGGSPELIG